MKAKSIPKRISAALLCLALLTSLLPVGALAADDPLGQSVPNETACICTVPCTAQAMNPECPVCSAEGATPEGCALYEETAPDSEQPAPVQETAIAGFEPLAEDVAAQTVQAGGEPVLPEILSAYQVGEDTELVPVEIAGVTWAAEPEYDPNIPGSYTFTAALPEGYALAEGVTLPTITVTVEEAQAPEPQPPVNNGADLLATTENVSYIDPIKNPTEQTCNSATVVIADDTTWGNDNNAGWYVVNSNVTISERVTVTGSNSLTIYGQSGGLENRPARRSCGGVWRAPRPDGGHAGGGHQAPVAGGF